MEIDPPLPNGNPIPMAAALAPAASKLTQLTESLKLEHQLLRVPFEHYKKTIRANHRIIEKEMSAVVSGVGEAVEAADLSADEAADRLNSLVSRLQGLKRKVWLFPRALFLCLDSNRMRENV